MIHKYFSQRMLLLVLVCGAVGSQAQTGRPLLAASNFSGHTWAITGDGSLWTWGGTLGVTGAILNEVPKVFMPGTTWRNIGAGAQHAAAVQQDGTLWTWGENLDGQLGDGTTTRRATPARIGTASNWASTAAGGTFTVALRQDGTLWSWGFSNNGALGTPGAFRRLTPQQVGTASNWAAISAGANFVVALRTDGTLWHWGEIGNSISGIQAPTQLGSGTNWVSIDAGQQHALAVRADGTLWTWGHNEYGELGSGQPGSTIYQPVQIGTDTSWVQATGGRFYTVALRTDGSLWFLGYNSEGQMGVPTPRIVQTLTRIGTATDWQQIEGGSAYLIAQRTNGSLWGWGNNSAGNIGSVDVAPATVVRPRQVGTATNWRYAVAGEFHSAGLRQDGTLWTWGNSYYGQQGNGTQASSSPPTFKQPATQLGTAADWSSLASGRNHLVATRTDGSCWTWGDNRQQQIGLGAPANLSQNVPAQISPGASWARAGAGEEHTLVARQDGTLWAWGYNIRGGLGNGTVVQQPTPVAVLAGAASGWLSLAGGVSHSVGVRPDGTLWAWGSNASGQLGTGTGQDTNVPIRVGTASNWKQVVACRYYSLGLRTDGTLWAWGYNDNGQLGTGNTTSSPVPVQIGNGGWAYVAAGHTAAAAVRQDGTLWTWGGLNEYGQLGDGTFTPHLVPAQVGTATNWSTVAVGVTHMQATRTDGTLWGWGLNGAYQTGSSFVTYEPVLIWGNNGPLASRAKNTDPLRHLHVYPNPARTTVRVLGTSGTQPVELLNALGAVVRRLPATTTEVDVRDLQAGLYVLRQGPAATRLLVE